GLARLQQLSATTPMTGSTNQRLAMGKIDDGSFADMRQWQEFYRGNTNYPQAPPNAAPAETVLTSLGKFDSEIKDLRDAIATHPYSRFPIQYGHQPSWEIL